MEPATVESERKLKSVVSLLFVYLFLLFLVFEVYLNFFWLWTDFEFPLLLCVWVWFSTGADFLLVDKGYLLPGADAQQMPTLNAENFMYAHATLSKVINDHSTFYS